MTYKNLAGEWKLDRSENYDDFLKAVGMNTIKRTVATKAGGSLKIEFIEDKKVKVIATNGPNTTEREMTFGQEFEDKGVDGTKGKGKISIEENAKLVARVVTEKGRNVIVTRYIEGGELVQEMSIDGTVCKRFYKKK